MFLMPTHAHPPAPTSGLFEAQLRRLLAQVHHLGRLRQVVALEDVHVAATKKLGSGRVKGDVVGPLPRVPL